MTENEAIKVLKDEHSYGYELNKACLIAIKALEEIQQYRAIGTVEQLEWCKDASHWKELFKEKLEKYEAIGTVEEFKAYKQGNCTNNCKHYDSTAEYVRNNAIDEFVERLKDDLITDYSVFDTDDIRLFIDTIEEIAEQLKAGV